MSTIWNLKSIARYRDQEHPQCFYVAEIFYELNPQSKFPDNNYPTFEKYYRDKYGIQIQNLKQPLLDVDHTSARLNFLTPRWAHFITLQPLLDYNISFPFVDLNIW